MSTYWKVAEDNGGNLYLYAWSGKFEYVHVYDDPGHLREDIKALENGSDIREWDGNEGYVVWDELMDHEYGSKVVAEGKFYRGKGATEYDFDAMGGAAHDAFGYTQEHYDDRAEDYIEDYAPFTGTKSEVIYNLAREVADLKTQIAKLKFKMR